MVGLKTNWIREVTRQFETNLINANIKYYMTLQIPTMHRLFLKK